MRRYTHFTDCMLAVYSMQIAATFLREACHSLLLCNTLNLWFLISGCGGVIDICFNWCINKSVDSSRNQL